jgi:hypothetical protein
MWLEPGTNQLSLSNADVKNEWRYTSTCQYASTAIATYSDSDNSALCTKSPRRIPAADDVKQTAARYTSQTAECSL